MILKDRVGRGIHIGDFIVYCTKTEAPSLRFGWILDIQTKTGGPGQATHKIKVRHADPDGTSLNKEIFDWDDVTNTGKYVTTDKPSTAVLSSYGYDDHRFMVVNPII